MSSIEAYRLAAALLARGFEICPCRHGEPLPYQPRTPTDGALRGWYSDLNADGVGIVDPETGSVTIVDEIPLSAAELEGRAEAQERARVEAQAAAERAKRRSYKESRRRANGVPERFIWLQTHSQDRDKVWEKFPMSRAQWFRKGKPKPETDWGGSPDPALRVRDASHASTGPTVSRTEVDK